MSEFWWVVEYTEDKKPVYILVNCTTPGEAVGLADELIVGKRHLVHVWSMPKGLFE